MRKIEKFIKKQKSKKKRRMDGRDKDNNNDCMRFGYKSRSFFLSVFDGVCCIGG